MEAGTRKQTTTRMAPLCGTGTRLWFARAFATGETIRATRHVVLGLNLCEAQGLKAKKGWRSPGGNPGRQGEDRGGLSDGSRYQPFPVQAGRSIPNRPSIRHPYGGRRMLGGGNTGCRRRNDGCFQKSLKSAVSNGITLDGSIS